MVEISGLPVGAELQRPLLVAPCWWPPAGSPLLAPSAGGPYRLPLLVALGIADAPCLLSLLVAPPGGPLRAPSAGGPYWWPRPCWRTLLVPPAGGSLAPPTGGSPCWWLPGRSWCGR